MKLFVPIVLLVAGCSATNTELTPGHQFYTDFNWSFSENCSDPIDRIKITATTFSVGNTICKIDSYEDKHWQTMQLRNCVSDGHPIANKKIIIRNTYNATFIDGWTENSQKFYRCSAHVMQK